MLYNLIDCYIPSWQWNAKPCTFAEAEMDSGQPAPSLDLASMPPLFDVCLVVLLKVLVSSVLSARWVIYYDEYFLEWIWIVVSLLSISHLYYSRYHCYNMYFLKQLVDQSPSSPITMFRTWTCAVVFPSW